MVHSTNGQLHEYGPNRTFEISRYWTKNAEQVHVKVEFESYRTLSILCSNGHEDTNTNQILENRLEIPWEQLFCTIVLEQMND